MRPESNTLTDLLKAIFDADLAAFGGQCPKLAPSYQTRAGAAAE